MTLAERAEHVVNEAGVRGVDWGGIVTLLRRAMECADTFALPTELTLEEFFAVADECERLLAFQPPEAHVWMMGERGFDVLQAACIKHAKECTPPSS
jgi:hypothetical protein